MRVFFFTGKGGVGKSSMAAVAGWQLSKRYRVLIVSLDPAHNLGDLFGVVLKNRRKKISDTLILEEVNIKRLARAYLEKETSVLSEAYPYLSAINLDSYFSILKYSPGIEEYALLTSIEKTINEDKDFDFIIFDTPPTGLTLRFLALPKITVTWIERLTAIRREILEKRYTIQKIRGNSEKEGTVTGIRLYFSEEDDDVLRRLKQLREKYDRLNMILQSDDCGIVLVFNPDFLSIRESERLITGLKELNLPLRLLIQNKVSPENMETAVRTARHLRAKLCEDTPFQQVFLLTTLGENGSADMFSLKDDITKYLDY